VSDERYERQTRIWGKKGQEIISNTSILLVGAGGTGCEILKNLSLLGFGKICVIDLDKIEITNLNRQFFFHDEDVGAYKAEIAAKRAKQINPNIEIIYFNKKIQDIPIKILESYDIFISALDNISARLYLNQKAVEFNKPLLDCGTEGFMGHVQVVIPRITPCLVCQDLWVRPETNFKCTYALHPRTPLDCALEARDKFFIKYNKLPDPDNENDLIELLQFAETHANKFNIKGVNTEIIKDALKGTVESIITINSIIGSVLVNELIKILISKLEIFENLKLKIITFFQFNGKTESGWSVPLERDEKCPVCGIEQIEIQVDRHMPLIQLIQLINQKLNNIFELPLIVNSNDTIIYREKIHLKNFQEKYPKNELDRLLKLENTPLNKILKPQELLFIKDESTGIKIKVKTIFN